MESDDATPACSEHLQAEEFDHADGEAELESRKPCQLCFRGEFELDDFAVDELVIRRSNESYTVHRPASSGIVGPDPSSHPGQYSNLAKQMQRSDVTDIDDIDFDRASGGEA